MKSLHITNACTLLSKVYLKLKAKTGISRAIGCRGGGGGPFWGGGGRTLLPSPHTTPYWYSNIITCIRDSTQQYKNYFTRLYNVHTMSFQKRYVMPTDLLVCLLLLKNSIFPVQNIILTFLVVPELISYFDKLCLQVSICYLSKHLFCICLLI